MGKLPSPSHFYICINGGLALSKRRCFDTDLKEVMSEGGLIRVNGINVLFDYDTNLNYYGSSSGYYIRNALGYKVFFKCRERQKAQEVADYIFGKNMYLVQAKV